MFPRTTVFQKWPKNPLTCFHVQMVSKMANRHQFYQLEPRRDCRTANENGVEKVHKRREIKGLSVENFFTGVPFSFCRQ
jgi:hypothetical protein